MEATISISNLNWEQVKQNCDESMRENVGEIIDSPEFLKDPTKYLIHLMIERGTGRARMDDRARAFIISKIPDFESKVGSNQYLKKIAKNRFQGDPKKKEIMTCFNESVKQENFQKTLKEGVDKLHAVKIIDKQEYEFTVSCLENISKFEKKEKATTGLKKQKARVAADCVASVARCTKEAYDHLSKSTQLVAEDKLRISLSIFEQAEKLQKFRIPSNACQEKANIE